ncbi:PREDICTED: uncharacterized protein LOC106820991 [Priapulus caudatus]|uniref:Uncharacterized protein LOC106820991 n=1 Tax=Priapulus caudatus TaxID=37621 RepID=A0ABM1F9H4_PRICU|nr:PREDICTED: uncharacterized protein LOC106820991 [Priapulus caudatus]
MPNEREYGKWKLGELKEELGKRRAKKSGKKADLVKRLEQYDRNNNFGKEQLEDEHAYKITTPPAEMYKDLNADSEFPNGASIGGRVTYLHLMPLLKTGPFARNFKLSVSAQWAKLPMHIASI